MKGKAGRPRIPLSNISNRKPSGLTGSPAADGDGEVQMNGKFAKGGTARLRADKKQRGGKGKK